MQCINEWNCCYFVSCQITDNPDNVLAFRAHDLAEYPAE